MLTHKAIPIVACMLIACAKGAAAEAVTDPLAELTPIAAGPNVIELGPTALAIARALDTSVDINAYAKILDARASELKSAIASAGNARAKLIVMADCIYGRWGFADRNALPADVFVSFVDVLDKRQWNCFGISVLYVALGERVGIPLELVAGRGHVCVRLAGTTYFVETTDGGRVHEGADYLAKYLPFPCVDPNEYKAVSAREAVAVSLTQTGGAVLAQGKADVAQSCFLHALEFDPNHAEAHAALGFLYTQTGPIDRAIQAFQAAINADSKLREAYGGLGAALYRKADFDGAAAALRTAVALCDRQPEPLFNLGQVLYDLRDFDGSIDALEQYVALVPNDSDGFIRLAFPLEDSGKLDEALAAYSKALRLNPEHPQALVNSGNILEKQRKWDAACEMYEKCVAASPDDWLAYAGLGRVFTATDRFADANKAFLRSIELDDRYPPSWIDFAKLERKRGNTSAAIDKLNRAIAIDPTEAEAHREIALVYLDQKDKAKAIEHARMAEQLGETLPDILRSLTAEKATEQ